MSPSAAELLGTPAVDPSAVAATSAAKRPAAAGFKEHLERASQSPLFNRQESSARSARPDVKRDEPADDRDRVQRDQAPAPPPDAAAKRSEAREADPSDTTAETKPTTTTDEAPPTDEPSDAAAEQAAGQAQAAAVGKPAEAAAPVEAVALAAAELAAEWAAGTSPETPAPETPQPPAVAPAAETVDPTRTVEEPTTTNVETPAAAVAPTEQVVGRPAAAGQTAAEQVPVDPHAEAAEAATQEQAAAPAEAATAVAKTGRPKAAAIEEKKSLDEKDERETAEAEAEPAAAAATGATPVAGPPVVDPTTAVRPETSPDDRRESNDKPKEVVAQSHEPQPAGHEAARNDPAGRTPTADGPAIRTPAAGGEGSTNLTQVERTRLVQRVAKAVQTAQERGGELKIRLSPPELGSIKLEVKLHEGVMSARIETETREAQRVLNENLLVLRERLAEQNIKVERFDVDVFNPGAGGGGNAADLAQQKGDGRESRGEAGGRGGSGSRDGGAAGETRTGDVRRPAVSSDGRINVVV